MVSLLGLGLLRAQRDFGPDVSSPEGAGEVLAGSQTIARHRGPVRFSEAAVSQAGFLLHQVSSRALLPYQISICAAYKQVLRLCRATESVLAERGLNRIFIHCFGSAATSKLHLQHSDSVVASLGLICSYLQSFTAGFILYMAWLKIKHVAGSLIIPYQPCIPQSVSLLVCKAMMQGWDLHLILQVSVAQLNHFLLLILLAVFGKIYSILISAN